MILNLGCYMLIRVYVRSVSSDTALISNQVTEAKMTMHIRFVNLCMPVIDDDISS